MRHSLPIPNIVVPEESHQMLFLICILRCAQSVLETH